MEAHVCQQFAQFPLIALRFYVPWQCTMGKESGSFVSVVWILEQCSLDWKKKSAKYLSILTQCFDEDVSNLGNNSIM